MKTSTLSAIIVQVTYGLLPRATPPSEVRVRGIDFTPSLKHDGHWKPTAALFMQAGQIGRSQRWQRTPAGRSGCR
ncbi:hypothetical protein GCM10022235_43020 [Kribbella ginsengisoli]|uniref:Uncharacterized protein n=1 Tax=Kribbella ginsengisoli TaxID=363865 RepID=A0ABP6XM12_9ACTN